MGRRGLSPAAVGRKALALRAAQPAETSPESKPEQAGSGRVERIGILGGTFDPPHLGHLWLATLAADELGLSRVLLMPAARPPHKGGRVVSNVADRVTMTRLAITGDPILDLSLVEMERPGPSYTVDSLVQLRNKLGPGVGLVLVMAGDSLADVGTWRQPERLLELAEWAVAPRTGSPFPDRAALKERFGAGAARIHLLGGPTLDVSSSEIRRRVAGGRSIRYLVPRSVEEFIVDRRLYRRG